MGDLIAVMDHLWFHQIILFSASTTSTTTTTTITTTTTLLISKTLKQHPPRVLIDSDSLIHSSSSSCNSLSNHSEDISPSTSSLPPPPHLDDLNNEEGEKKDYCNIKKERPTRVNKIKSRARSHSSSPLTSSDHNKHEKNRGRNPQRRYNRAAVLQKSMSCRSLGDLELEEVKGFMDLGFIFKKEHLNPRILSLIPGLQRLGCYYKNPKSCVFETTCTTTTCPELAENYKMNNGFNGEEGERGANVIRPYLSEAWLIRKPNSPLLNLRLPRVTAAADMKKHLIFWARIVASEIQQES